MTETVLVREEVEREAGVILVTSLRMAARSSFVVERRGFLVGGREGVVGLVRPVTVEEGEGAAGELVEVRGTVAKGAGEARTGVLVVVLAEEEEEKVEKVDTFG